MPKVFDKQAVLNRLNEYIDNHRDPLLREFCIDRNNPCEDTLYEWAKDKNSGFSEAIKRLVNKQECFLVRADGINPVMAIFRLKQPQHGYKDKQDISIDGNITQTIKPVLLD